MRYDTPDEIRSRFNQMADSYVNKVTNTIPFYDETIELMTNLLIHLPQRPLKILDLGCGPGILANTICSKINKVEITIVDFAENMLTKALMVLEAKKIVVNSI